MKSEHEPGDDKDSGEERSSLPSAEIEPEKRENGAQTKAHKPTRLLRRKNRWMLESVIGALGVVVVTYYTYQAKRQADAMIEANRMNVALATVAREANTQAREAAKAADEATAKVLEQFKRSADAAKGTADTSAASLAEMRGANRDAIRARLEFIDAVTEKPEQIDKPDVFLVTIVNSGRHIVPWYVTEKSCVDYGPVMPTTIPCSEGLALLPGRKALPMWWESGQPDAVGHVAETLRVDRWIHERTDDMLLAYWTGRINVYWFVTIKYADGVGGVWRREGCWYITKWDAENALVGNAPGLHYILPCRGFPREAEVSGSGSRTVRH